MNKILLALQAACADPGTYTPRLGPDADHRDRDYEPHSSWHARACALALEQIAIDHFEITILDQPPRKYLAQQFPAIQGHLPVDEWVSRMLLLAAAGWQIELMIGDMLEAFAVPKQKATGGGPREMRVPERVEWLGFKAQRLEKAYEKQQRMLDAILAEVEGLVDGAPDADSTARLANRIAVILEGRSPVFERPTNAKPCYSCGSALQPVLTTTGEVICLDCVRKLALTGGIKFIDASGRTIEEALGRSTLVEHGGELIPAVVNPGGSVSIGAGVADEIGRGLPSAVVERCASGERYDDFEPLGGSTPQCGSSMGQLHCIKPAGHSGPCSD